MTGARTLGPGGLFVVWLLMLVGWSLIGPALLQAQTYPGDNVVYSASTQNSEFNSHAFIDASKLAGNNICAKINTALVQLANTSQFPGYGGAGLIDARGIPSSNLTCTSSPWSSGVFFPSTILLPAGTITIPNTWILPNNTTLIGEGDDIGSGTTIQAKISFPGTDMIDLGASNICPPAPPPGICNNVSVENLTLDGQGQTINGIVNSNSQTGSRVDHVSLYRILGTGLLVSGNAQDSGPYTNITFNTLSQGSQSTACAQLKGLNGTKGIRGLTCISPPDSPHAILLDSSNNILSDIRIVGFYDGILIGSLATAQSNVLLNVVGDSSLITNTPAPINVIHISHSHPVTDLSVMGANNQGSGNTIWDEPTSTTLFDLHVAMYVLGRPAPGASGFSRFTTSPNAATWAVGTSVPNGSCSSNASGSLYSNTSGAQPALYVCPVGGGPWKGIR